MMKLYLFKITFYTDDGNKDYYTEIAESKEDVKKCFKTFMPKGRIKTIDIEKRII